MTTFYNLAKMTVSGAAGTGTLTLLAAVPGWLTFDQAGVPNGATVCYAIVDGTDCEIGLGTYTTSGTTLSRTTVRRSSGAANTGKISATANAVVYITVGAEDIGTAAALNAGTGANNLVQLNGSSQLPAVSGALLTNLPATGAPLVTGSALPVNYSGPMWVTASSLTAGSSTSGSNVRTGTADSSGVFVAGGVTQSGTWRNDTGVTVGAGTNNVVGQMTRTA